MLPKIERGLSTLQTKLQDLLSKPYAARTGNSSLHRDTQLRLGELANIVAELRNQVGQPQYIDAPRLQAIVVTPPKQPRDSRLWAYPHEQSEPRLQKLRNEARLKRLAGGHQEVQSRTKAATPNESDRTRAKSATPAKKSKPSKSPDMQSPGRLSRPQWTAENESGSETIMANIAGGVRRAVGLAAEYKKIDDNLEKLVRFLAAKHKSSLLPRYKAMLDRSEISDLVSQSERLRLLEHRCKEEVSSMLKSAYEQMRVQVNAMKNQTKERRDILIMMVRNDKLTVENVQVTPQKT